MSLHPCRAAWLPLAGVLIAVAGCGSTSSAKTNATATAQSAALAQKGPTPPTAVIAGGDTAAIVNGHKVPMSTYRLLFNFNQREYATSPGATTALIANRTMQQVIAQEITRQYADRHGVKVGSADVNRVLRQQEQRSGGPQAFQQTLARFGLTTETFKKLVEPSLLEQKVAQKVVPLKATMQPVARVRHILIGTTLQGKRIRSDAAARAKANHVLAQLKHGVSFASLAKKDSDDPGKVQNGGYYTVHPHDQMVPQFLHAAFSQPVHRPTIVKTMFGYHVFEVVSRGKAPAPLQDQQAQQEQRFGAWIRQQEAHASIKRIARVKSSGTK